MSMIDKPSLAIVCNYADNSCGIAAYTRLREKSFAAFFDVTVFELNSASLMRSLERRDAADQRIDEICTRLADFDLVDLDSEFGIWGADLLDCEARMIRCIESARRLVFTMHRVDIDHDKNADFALAEARILDVIARRDASKPFHVIAHARTEADILRTTHGLDHVSSHPLSFVTASEKATLRLNADPAAWKASLGFAPDDIVIGVFGAFSKYKDNATVLRALSVLPECYKVAFVGGAHPFSSKPLQTDENVADLLALIEQIEIGQPGFGNRIRFGGVVGDDLFRTHMQNSDLVVVPYFDAGQLASGVASMAFELGKCIVATHTNLFLEYRLFYGDCFEMFDPGNYLELRDRIMAFDPAKMALMEQARDRYTPETMAALTHDIHLGMAAPDYANVSDVARLAAFIRGFHDGGRQPATSADLEHARKAYHEAVQVQNILKAEKTAAEEAAAAAYAELAELRLEFDALRESRSGLGRRRAALSGS